MKARDSNVLASFDASHIDALVELMLLAASADGQLGDAEVQVLRQVLLAIDGQCLSQVDIGERLLIAAKRIDAASRSERLAELRKALVSPEQRLAALELVLRVVTADREIQSSEHDVAVEVAQALEIDSGVAGALIMKRLY